MPLPATGMRLHAHRYANETGQRGYGNPMAANGYRGYYEHVLDKVPYGSQLWWRVDQFHSEKLRVSA